MSADVPEPDAHSRAIAYRIIDANLNRCMEGLRVTEEYVRFAWGDQHLSAVCKEVRHELLTLANRLPISQLHAMRDVAGDIGTTVSTEGEYQRKDLWSVAAANVKRVEQSLRSMEEYAKVVSPAVAPAFESLRYRTYVLERALSVRCESRRRLDGARLYVLIDGRESLAAFCNLVTALCENGADLLQLRDKTLSDRELLARARALPAIVRRHGVLFIMNDRADIALAARADGVHLGQSDMPIDEARRLLGPEALIGISTHSIDQARQAVLDGANYIGCGPTFPSTTKTFTQFPGLGFLREVSREIRLPAFAIGGISGTRIGAVCETGMFRVAVRGAALDASDPGQATRQLANQLRSASAQPPER